MKRKGFYLISFTVLLLVFFGCSNTDNNQSVDTQTNTENKGNETSEVAGEAGFPVSFTLHDEEVIIQEKPERILPLSLDVAEIVLELVDPSEIAAITKGIDDPLLSTNVDEAKAIPERISAAVNIDPEEIISYDTDLLLLTKVHGQEAEAEGILERLDIPILTFNTMVTVDAWMDNISIIGEAVGEKEKAEQLVNEMQAQIQSIQATIPKDGEAPSVLILSEVGPGTGPFILGPSNISYDIINLAGAIPAVDSISLDRSTPASIEQVIKMEPDYVYLLDFAGNGEKAFEELVGAPGWDALQAVQNDRVKIVEAKYLMNPNVEIIQGLERMTQWIYDLED